MTPTPDIDIGELRRLEKAADGLGYPHHARSRFREKLEYAAPALLAAAEEGERLTKLLSFDGCDADDVVSSMPNKFPDALIVRRSWFEGERREELKNTENRYIEAMDENERLTSRLALAEAVVIAACRLVAADTYVHPMLSRADAVKAGVAELHDAVGKWQSAQPAQREGKSE